MNFQTPKKYKAILTNKSWISSKVLQADFKLMDPQTFDFVPGQFISLNVAENKFRVYSISSDSQAQDTLSIVVEAAHQGLGANFLKELQIGSDATFIGPSGRFVFSEKSAKETIFIATGTGIAPFIPMIMELIRRNSKAKIRLYFGLRHEEHIFYVNYLEEFKNKLSDFEYYICLSQPNNSWRGLKGYITKFIEVEDKQNAQIYICGHPNMIDDMIDLLNQLQIPKGNIFYEKFKLTIT